MTPSPLDTTTARALVDLDPAPSTSLTPGQQARADRSLKAILTHEPRGAGPADPDVLPGPGRRRLAIVGATAAVAVLVTLAFLAALAHRTGDPRGAVLPAGPPTTTTPAPPSTEGRWTATPVPVSNAVAEELARTCRDSMLRGQQQMDDPPESGAARFAWLLGRSQLVLSERRGGWIYVWLATDDGLNAACVFGDSTVPGQRSDDGYVHAEEGGGLDAPHPTPRPDGLVAQPFAGTITTVGGRATTTGFVGADVSGVLVDVRDGRRVEATVENGRFLAWWPMTSDAFPDDVTYTVTLRDGTVLPPIPYSEAVAQ